MMKLINIFKKETPKVNKANIQPLGKAQLEKVIGGGDGDATPPIILDAARVKSHSNQTNN